LNGKFNYKFVKIFGSFSMCAMSSAKNYFYRMLVAVPFEI
jgi:hypothetical protein